MDMDMGKTSYGRTSTPTQALELSDVTAIAAGSGYCLALLADGSVCSWGNSYAGALGLDDKEARSAPAQIPDLSEVVAISATMQNSLALKSDGTVWEWGGCPTAELGNTEALSPVQAAELYDVTAIAAGYHHSLAISDGVVCGWGDNTYDDLGVPYEHYHNSPKEVWVRLFDDHSDKREEATVPTGDTEGLPQHAEDKDWFSFTPIFSQN
jgi:alpha-tubulin suppressor-like RCC1 family protein